MDQFIVQLSILDPLYVLFGWLARHFYNFFGNYGLAIIALTVLIRVLMIPLNIKSQKAMLKMQALSGQQAELQRKYGHDKQKYQEELTKLQQENGAMGCSGCLLPFLQIFFIWPIYRIVSGPLVYISQVPKSNVRAMIKVAKDSGIITGSVSTKNHIGLIRSLNNSSELLQYCVGKGYINMKQIIDLHFLGIDLTRTPSINPAKFVKDPGTYFPLLIFPALVLIIQIFSMKMSQMLKPGYKEEKGKKKRAKNNPALSGQVQDDVNARTMQMMTWLMPIMMLATTFMLPAAMGLYWVVGGIMGIITQLMVYVLFTKPYELKKAEVEAKKEAVFKKKKADDADKEQDKKNQTKKSGNGSGNGSNKKNGNKNKKRK